MPEIKDLLPSVDNPTFEAFWEVWPRKTEKAKGKEAFEKLSLEDKLAAIKGAEYHASSNPQWRNPKLIPHPSTFLNRKRWLDEIVEDIDAKARVHQSVSTGPAMAVWKAMTQMFGEPWIKRHGETPTEVWVTQLAKVPRDKLSQGLAAVKDSGAVFPPSLPEFLALCYRQPNTLPEFKSLPKPWPTPEVADPAFDQLREILRYR